MLPTVSIIVLTYNQELTISQTLDSIVSQRCNFPIEIIIGEDCSHDNTRSICINYKKKYPGLIRLHLHQTNQGIVKNFYSLTKLCRGNYIAHCAGDDYWCDDLKLQKQYDYLVKNPNYGFVRTANYELNTVTGKLTISKNYSKAIGYVFDLAKYGPVAASATIFFKKELLKYVNFSEFVRRDFSIEDYPMQAIMSKYTKFGFINDVTAVYRIYEGSGSRPFSRKKIVRYNKGFAAAMSYLSQLFPNEIEFDKNKEDNFILRNYLQFAFDDYNYSNAKYIANSMINPDSKNYRLIALTKNRLIFFIGCIVRHLCKRLELI